MSLQQVMEDNEVESLKARVQLIIDEEALMSKSELNNPENFPEFIQVLQAHRRPEPPWNGLGGKMATEVQKINEKVDQMKLKLEKIDQVEEKVDQMHEKVEAKVDKLACEMTELKELMMKMLEASTSN
jgi:outer membrane murein-binding lipoprotein Lpp